jgi:hypothetical protein
MSNLRTMYKANKSEIWQQLSQKIEAHYVKNEPPVRSKIVAKVDSWTVTMDTHIIQTYHDKFEYLRMRAPFVNADGFRFQIHQEHLSDTIGKILGLQDVTTGHEEFDKKFIVQTNNEDKIKKLVSNKRIREIIKANPNINIEVKADDGYFSTEFPDGVDELYLLCEDATQDAAKMEELYELFSEVLHQLCHIGSAYEDDPNITFD